VIEIVTNIAVQGFLLGGLFCLYALGLSLVFGVMKVVNVAHGDFIVIAAYISLFLITTYDVAPFATLVLLAPVMGIVGYLLQRTLINHILGEDLLPPFLVTFGLSVVIQNVLLLFSTADSRRIDIGSLALESIQLAPNVSIGTFPLIVFGVAVFSVAVLELGIRKTVFGRNVRAVADDPKTAQLMGISPRQLFAIAAAIAFVFIAITGVIMGARTNFDPFTGPQRLLLAFETVVIGGLGSLWGTLSGAILLGLAHSIGGALNPQWQLLAGHIVFLIVLIIRPSGLSGKS
jgi:branched-chain amino acid transport system permease protein